MSSRQYKEQEVRKAKGLCRYCPNAADKKRNGEPSGLCTEHRTQTNARSNRYYHAKKQLKSDGLEYGEFEPGA